MVTTKRMAKSERERVGGYGSEPAVPSILSDFDRTDGSFSADYSNADIMAGPVPSIVKKDLKSQPTQAPAEQPIPNREPKAKPTLKNELIKSQESEDLRPTAKTQQYADDIERRERPAEKSRPVLDSRTKLLLCVYIVVALVLAIAVIATGAAISAASDSVDSLSRTVSVRSAELKSNEVKLAEARNDQKIRAMAEQNGMVSAGEPTYTFERAADYDYPEATPKTSGFDTFMDWMSKVIN